MQGTAAACSRPHEEGRKSKMAAFQDGRQPECTALKWILCGAEAVKNGVNIFATDVFDTHAHWNETPASPVKTVRQCKRKVLLKILEG